MRRFLKGAFFSRRCTNGEGLQEFGLKKGWERKTIITSLKVFHDCFAMEKCFRDYFR